MAQRSFLADFRQFFGRGLSIVLPTILTLWILWYAAVFVFDNVAEPINRGIRAAVVYVAPQVMPEDSLPGWARVSSEELTRFRASPEGKAVANVGDERVKREIVRRRLRTIWGEHWYLAGSGLVVAIVLIYFAGLLLGGLIGRRVTNRVEALLTRVPGFKQVYPHVKQVVEMVIGERPIAFNRVVLVQYPRKGVWTVAFVTGNSLRIIHEQAGAKCLSVFVPSTPMPFTGFTITVPEDDLIDLPMSIEEAVRFFVTGGVLVPPSESPDGKVDPSGTLPKSSEESTPG